MNIKKLSLLLIYILFIKGITSAQRITISGYVQNAQTNEVIIGANVYNLINMQGTTTNNFGYFAFSVTPGNYALKVSCVGYTSIAIPASFTNDTLLIISLTEGKSLDEITVTAPLPNREISSPVSLSQKQIRMLPNLTGEFDVLKAFQYLPGIAQGAEGNNSLYVRGGSPDQNLILLDDVPLYYVNHIGGLVSIFDEYAVSDVSVFKSGFPARYGGRLSSVVDVRMKNGKMDKLGGEISIGLISSKLSIEGPIIKNKMSYMISARKSMTDFYMRPISRRTLLDNDGFMVYSFYDFNGKINYILSKKDRLYASFYKGADMVRMSAGFDAIEGATTSNENYSFANESLNGWGNTMGCIRWNHLFSPRLFGNLTLAVSNYFFQNHSLNEITINETKLVSETFLYDFKSGVRDQLAKIDFDYFASNKQHIRFGASVNNHNFNTGKLHQFYHVNKDALPDSSLRIKYKAEMDTLYGGDPMHAIETTAYIEDAFNINKNLSVNAGLHFASYSYTENTFYSWQPRLAIKWKVAEQFTANLSYASMAQFIHMLTGSDTNTPTDIWVPSTNNAKPEQSNQFSFGVEKEFIQNGFKLTTEFFYKTMNELIDYKLGANIVSGSTAWYEKIESGGRGTVYGAELLLEKTKGRITGWVSYTLSKNTRQFENINNGNVYPYVYDRPHDLSIVTNYKLNDKISFSSTWEYRSGRRMTLGAASYDAITLKNSLELITQQTQWMSEKYRHSLSEWTYETATIYGTKNNYKLPDYHKLCINAHFKKEKKYGTRTFTVGINNVYNQRNAYNVFYETDKNGILYLKKMTLFPIMPSVSYSFRF